MTRTIVVALGLFMLSASAAHAQDSDQSSESERVIAAFLAALDNHDVSRAAQFVGTDAQLLTPQPVNGRLDIEKWLGQRFAEDTLVEVSPYSANGQRVTWMTRLNQTGTMQPLGAWAPRYQLTWDEAVVVKGRITLWSTRVLTEPLFNGPHFRRANTMAPASDPLQAQVPHMPLYGSAVGVAIALVAGIGYGVWESRRPPRQQLQGGVLLRTLHERLAGQR